jgi:hypothetical protein
MMLELKKTQIEVLKVLANHENLRMGTRDIMKCCKVNPSHIVQAIRFFMDIDLVYQPDNLDRIQISPEGMDYAREYSLV